MPPLVCLDLDRTVIYSPRALDLPVPDMDAPRLLCVEVYRGAPLSFVTETAATLFERLCRDAVVVPCTTRTPEQLARVHLPGDGPRYAIASNGGHLLVDGHPDPDWAGQVRRALAGCSPVEDVLARVQEVSGPFVETVRGASDRFVYAGVNRPALPDGWEQDLRDWCAPRGWGVSVQGRKMYCVPVPLTKSAAAAELARRTGATAVLAAGDSLLDRDLLEFAGVAARPRQGELADVDYRLPGLYVPQAPGVLGGEELLRWLGEHPLVRGTQVDGGEGSPAARD